MGECLDELVGGDVGELAPPIRGQRVPAIAGDTKETGKIMRIVELARAIVPVHLTRRLRVQLAAGPPRLWVHHDLGNRDVATTGVDMPNGNAWGIALGGAGSVSVVRHASQTLFICLYHTKKSAARARLVRRSALYRVEWFDDEIDSRVWMDLTDPAEARAEAIWRAASIDRVEGLVALPALQAATRNRAEPVMVDDLLLTCHVEQCTLLDGVWWEDRLDELALSAPRGVIVPSRLPAWQITPEHAQGRTHAPEGADPAP